MARTWTAEQREAQRRRCLETKPWTRSTGPTSEEGKLISSMNNLRHGLYCKRNKIVRMLATWLLQAQQFEECKAELATWLPQALALRRENPALFDTLIFQIQSENKQETGNPE